MSSSEQDFEKIRTELQILVARHKRTRAWFWRTGISSLAAAALWLIMYNVSSDQAGVKETLAIIVGAALMWVLFSWSFFLLRKLNRLTVEIKGLEKKMDVILNTEGVPGDVQSPR